MVTAINGLDTIQSNNEPFQISIEIGSGEIIPLAPFNLKYPWIVLIYILMQKHF